MSFYPKIIKPVLFMKLKPHSNPIMIKTMGFSTLVVTNREEKSTNRCVSPGSFLRTNFLADLEGLFEGAPKLVKEFYEKHFGNFRSSNQLEFSSKKSKEGYALFLNVCGCNASELVVKVRERFVYVGGEGKALSDDTWKHSKGISLPEEVKFDLRNVIGYVQKGQVQVYFPWVADEEHNCHPDDLNYDMHDFHQIKCVDLPITEKAGLMGKPELREADELAIDIDIFEWASKWFLTFCSLLLTKMGIRAYYAIPEALDFYTEFNEKGFNAFLNVAGCSAGELAVTVSGRKLMVDGKGASMAGRSEVKMKLEFPSNFKFNPDEVRANYLKGELQVLFPYTKMKIDLEQKGDYLVPSLNVDPEA